MTTGVNYPWLRYGGDFGPTVWGTSDGIRAHASEVRVDLTAIASSGVDVVRWFVFTDARGGIEIDTDGWPIGMHSQTLADLDALFALALDAGVQIVPVLFDHLLAFDAIDVAGAIVGGHAAWLAEPTGQARLLETVVAPLARRYSARGSHAHLGAAVHAWDLFNEPDWILAELHPSPRVTTPVAFDVFAAWVRAAIAEIRRRDAGRVTLGNARLRFARWWDDPSFGFDFLQAHAYYDPDHDFDLLETSPGALGLSCPLVVGECSARGDAADPVRDRPALTLAEFTAAARVRGFAGVWPWSWRGADAHGGLAPTDLAPVRNPFES